MPIHTAVRKHATFAELATSVSQHMRLAKAHALAPLGEVVRRLKLPRDTSRNALFQVTIAPQVGTPSDLELAGLQVSALDTDQVSSTCRDLIPSL